MKTPLLFIVFNRPEATKRVFEEIRKARPEKLFISADGPRSDRPDDIEKCQKTREVVQNVDWPCEVKTLFREKNLGCKLGASSAVTWFFENVEEGIILEDDCVPDPTFFIFCTEMLSHFRNEKKVAMICGYNIVGESNIPYSYNFSRYGHLWGWASWRRVWDQYDISMKIWEDPVNRQKIKKAMNDKEQWNYREWLYNETYHGRKDTWDYQWESYRLLHGQICVIPSRNMIRNIGFGYDATHTKQLDSHLIIAETSMKFPLKHNPHLEASDEYDSKLRPPIKATSMKMRIIKGYIKKISKLILPPLIYNVAQKHFRKIPTKPIWNTLTYEPMEGVRMFFNPLGSWQKKILDGSYDKFMFERLSRVETEGKVIFDIGAHVGFHSLYFAKLVGPRGKVVAFEPNQKNFERINLILDQNPELKKRIVVLNKAVSDKYTTEEFNMSNDIEGGRSSGNFMERGDPFFNKESYKEKGFEKTTIETVPLDLLDEKLGINEAPDIIKLDVEGAEFLALRGAHNILLTKKPLLFIEIHSMQNMFNVTSLLESLSYDVKIVKIENNGVCYLEAKSKK